MEEGLVSVVMPAYNCERTLAQAVESVQAQSYANWELLILDDCSRDGTWAQIQSLAARDGRIRPIQNERNSGAGFTRNRGVQLAAGEWIAFLDSDDVWTADKLEKQLLLRSGRPEASLFFTGSGFMRADGSPIDYVLRVPKKIDRRHLLRQNRISCSSVLVRRERMLEHPFPEKKELHEDFAVWLAILKEEPYAYGVDEPLLIYRRSDSSKSGNKRKAAVMNWNTYRFSGLNMPQSAYYMAWYAVKSLIKYSHL